MLFGGLCRLEDDFATCIEHPKLLHFLLGRGERIVRDDAIGLFNSLIEIVRVKREAHFEGVEGIGTGVVEVVGVIVGCYGLHISFGIGEVRLDECHGFLQRGACGACVLVYGGHDGQAEAIGSSFGLVVLAVAHNHVAVSVSAGEVSHAFVVHKAFLALLILHLKLGLRVFFFRISCFFCSF